MRVDRTRKIPVTALVRALGYGSDGRILELFRDDSRIRATLERDSTKMKKKGWSKYISASGQANRLRWTVPVIYWKPV